MHAIIDVSSNVAAHSGRLAAAGVKTVIRYYNHRNSTVLPSKCLTAEELAALLGAGLSVAVVFEQHGGADGAIEDFGPEAGDRDAARALELAADLGQPEGSAIYFAVDWDYSHDADLDRITSYFEHVRRALGDRYAPGVYGSGTVGDRLKAAALVEHVWLSGSLGWSGTRAALEAGRWSIFQKYLHITSEIGGFGCDGNVANPAHDNYGQFSGSGPAVSARGEGVAALYRVTARPDLNLRGGPGSEYRIIRTLPTGMAVTGLSVQDRWLQVDVDGDGSADGYVFKEFLAPLSGGLPDPNVAGAPSAYAVAREELARDVREIEGAKDNPRIVLYHSTTKGGAAPDEVSWCSSFVNYCVEQSGRIGTDSKWAMSWHDQDWGEDVTADPREGDIVVLKRRDGGPKGAVLGGHVGFLVEATSSGFNLLGGNQSNRIRISDYPRNGMKGPYHYKLLSIRRG